MNQFIHIFAEAEGPGFEFILNTNSITRICLNEQGFCDVYIDKGGSSFSKIRTLLSLEEVLAKLQCAGAKFIRMSGPDFRDHLSVFLNTMYIKGIYTDPEYDHCTFVCDPETGLSPRYETFYKMSELIELL